jgi:hypothetical protein
MVCEIAADVERLDERSVWGFRGVLRHEQDAIRAHQLRTCSLFKSGGTAGKGLMIESALSTSTTDMRGIRGKKDVSN